MENSIRVECRSTNSTSGLGEPVCPGGGELGQGTHELSCVACLGCVRFSFIVNDPRAGLLSGDVWLTISKIVRPASIYIIMSGLCPVSLFVTPEIHA